MGTKTKNELRGGIKHTQIHGEPREGVRYSNAQRKNDKSVFGIVSCLQRVIPTVKHFEDRTRKADQQNKADHDL